jgi:hypothetical protein
VSCSPQTPSIQAKGHLSSKHHQSKQSLLFCHNNGFHRSKSSARPPLFLSGFGNLGGSTTSLMYALAVPVKVVLSGEVQQTVGAKETPAHGDCPSRGIRTMLDGDMVLGSAPSDEDSAAHSAHVWLPACPIWSVKLSRPYNSSEVCLRRRRSRRRRRRRGCWAGEERGRRWRRCCCELRTRGR